MLKKGSTMLKVVSILEIVFSALGVLGAFLVIAIGGVLQDPTNELTQQMVLVLKQAELAPALIGLILSSMVIIGMLSLLYCILQLVVGIIGVKLWAKPEKYKVCVIAGIVMVAVYVLNQIISLSVFGMMPNFSALTGAVLPALYLVGAFENKKIAQTNRQINML